jgi:predicted DNA-binding transcriptional regulator AlpA
MAKEPLHNSERHLDSARVLERFGITKRTLCRWMADEALAFPKAIVIRRRNYFRESEIVVWEKMHGRANPENVDQVDGCAVVSGVITRYADFVQAMVERRASLKISGNELEAISGMLEGYVTKLENFHRNYGRGVGPETLPLWLGGLRVGIVLVDLPRRTYRPRERKTA